MPRDRNTASTACRSTQTHDREPQPQSREGHQHCESQSLRQQGAEDWGQAAKQMHGPWSERNELETLE